MIIIDENEYVYFTVYEQQNLTYATQTYEPLTHLGRVAHICVGNVTIIGSENGVSPGRRQAIVWSSAGILLIGPFGTSYSEILVEIHTFLFKKIHSKRSAKWRPFCFRAQYVKTAFWLRYNTCVLLVMQCLFKHNMYLQIHGIHTEFCFMKQPAH